MLMTSHGVDYILNLIRQRLSWILHQRFYEATELKVNNNVQSFRHEKGRANQIRAIKPTWRWCSQYTLFGLQVKQ